MEKIAVTKTELVWPGKYNDDGTCKEAPRVDLPLHLHERFCGGRKGESTLDQWHNKLIWGDNLLVMDALLAEFAGKIDLIYIDPPFATGTDFLFARHMGEAEAEPPLVQEKAYHDTWGRGLSAYLSMLWERFSLLRKLLSDTGSFYVHVGWEIGSCVQLLLNEIFGQDCLQNVIIYNYGKFHHSKERWKRDFEVILFYSKNPQTWTFNHDTVRDAYRVRTELRFDKVDENGERYKVVKGRRVYHQGGVTPSSVWRLSNLQMNARESLGYPTQKTEELLSKIITASSKPGDLVADFFCGSGTTLAVAEKLGRRWIGCDLGRFAIHTTRKRLLGIAECQPFDLLDLGTDERRYWCNRSFPVETGGAENGLRAYRTFVLKLYGARPVANGTHLHGVKGRAMVHVGALTAPITCADLNAALDESVGRKRTELHILGWDWEPGLCDFPCMRQAQEKGVRVFFFQVPREIMDPQAVEKGDVRFFAMASVKVEVAAHRDDARATSTVQITLTDFSLPDGALLPTGIRAKMKHWSDYIDYWAVDWDFQSKTFMPGWVTYRTHKDRALALTSEPHLYDQPGSYRVLVKIVDIFGNETSRQVQVES